MRTWGIRVAIVVAATAMNLLEGALAPPLAGRFGIDLHTMLSDEIVMGVCMGVVICAIHAWFRRQYERKLKRAVDDLNHHVRNSMQMIVNRQVLCPHCEEDDISQEMRRVDWALRELLPEEIQPRREPETVAKQH